VHCAAAMTACLHAATGPAVVSRRPQPCSSSNCLPSKLYTSTASDFCPAAPPSAPRWYAACRAQQVADRILPAYNTPTGIPLNIINLATQVAKNPTWNQRWVCWLHSCCWLRSCGLRQGLGDFAAWRGRHGAMHTAEQHEQHQIC
jgi:hypothetical protein